MAILKRNYTAGDFESVTQQHAGAITAGVYQYFVFEGYFKFELSDIIVYAGSPLTIVDSSLYDLVVDQKYTEKEVGFSGKTLYAMIRFNDISLDGSDFYVSGNNFGTMVDNEEVKRYIDDKINNAVISAQITSPSLSELQDLVDAGVSVFMADTSGGLTILPTGTLNLQPRNYYFIGSVRNDGGGFQLSGDLNLNYSEFQGPHKLDFRCMLNLYGHRITSNAQQFTVEKLSAFTLGSEIDTTTYLYIESLILSSSSLKCIDFPLRYQYLDNKLGGTVVDNANSDITESCFEYWVRPTEKVNAQVVEIDSSNKTYADRVFDVVDKTTGAVLGSIRGNGEILWGAMATMANLLVGTLQVVTDLTVDGVANFGNPTNENGTINVRAIQTGFEGYSFVVPAGSDTVGNYGVSAATSVDYPSDTVWEYTGVNGTYYLYSGKITSNKYWFIGTTILTGTDAFTDCQFRHTVASGTGQGEQDAWFPQSSAFIGINAPDTSLPASAVVLSGVAGPAINSDGPVHLINIANGLPVGATKAGGLSITSDGIVYIE